MAPRRRTSALRTNIDRDENTQAVARMIHHAAENEPRLAPVLKRFPLELTTVALELPEPWHFVTGRRQRDVPTKLAMDFVGVQNRLSGAAGGQVSPETIGQFLQVVVDLLNAMIVEWNLHEYARTDGQPYSRAGQLTIDDIGYMPQGLMRAFTSAMMTQTKAQQAASRDEKKDSSAT